MATQNPNTTAAAAEQEAAQKPKRNELKIGEFVRLSAVHGLLIHPFNQTEFDTDKSVKVEVDSWTKIQFDAGKLKVDED